jgi:hypothetical protein
VIREAIVSSECSRHISAFGGNVAPSSRSGLVRLLGIGLSDTRGLSRGVVAGHGEILVTAAGIVLVDTLRIRFVCDLHLSYERYGSASWIIVGE